MTWIDQLEPRQQKELDFAREYATHYQHGTDGHSRLMLIARLAELLDQADRFRSATEAFTDAIEPKIERIAAAATNLPTIDGLVALAKEIGAQGIWLVRGAVGGALIWSDTTELPAEQWPSMVLQMPHELIVLMRFPSGDGGEPGVEFRG